MGLFNNNYNIPGPGVPKRERQKNSFFEFFDIYFTKFWKLLELNALYFACCLPIVTIGAATAGFTYVLKNIVAGKQIFVFHDFFKGFKNNWKMGSLLFLFNIIAFIIFFIGFSFYGDPAIITNATLRIFLCGQVWVEKS